MDLKAFNKEVNTVSTFLSVFLAFPPAQSSLILQLTRSFMGMSWPLRWLLSQGLALSFSYIKAVFTGLITRIRAPSLLCGGSSVARVAVAFCGPGWPAYGSSS